MSETMKFSLVTVLRIFKDKIKKVNIIKAKSKPKWTKVRSAELGRLNSHDNQKNSVANSYQVDLVE